ncbi:DUF4954 family protein [Flavihumibacter sp. CACIAM 22H1]|uniref:DUF4954 family protein n=1 Tax=Flavihumibacter sp. CACIAM 22H1 TaxID=1812911 RepID=UPI0007A85895|nr:DUF4954 family protein [Flavihumibacter sp. CACIAM 22H1]KYP14666.1 MAG: hypothetical protein A1D16_09680 [Flavihumibacter sp. CACIAM 22H1]
MNIIKKHALQSLGYGFVEDRFLKEGKDEYFHRNRQNNSGIRYRQLTAYEIEVLVRNRNQSDDWNKLLVSDAFNPELVKNCKFYGLVRIGKLEPYCLEFNNLRMAVGLYNSTIISADFGDNVVVDNVNYLSHFIIGNEVMLVNINELATSSHSKFGNGIIKEGEDEKVRIWLEICNENGGRRILPFDGMLPGDAYLWSRNRQDDLLQQRFVQFTNTRFDAERGHYGKIGDRTVIKNSRILKDVLIGSDAYIKGANKIKNVTIHSQPNARTQVGEGCELVNGIIGEGCRVFYGVKAVRFMMASHSQLKYGARLINSYLGNNATISCCEVLNSLIFPAHEQHHNNSFLCAALVMGQSNMAAGATIGSNHNSRAADGELIAGRGFWPGLCVSLKHNSKFASFSILAKGDFPAELNIRLPFSLISNDVTNDQLVVMPAYWFEYNMYALARNSWKYVARDQRITKIQLIEYDYLAPDTATELSEALAILTLQTGKAWYRKEGKEATERQMSKKGKILLEQGETAIQDLVILLEEAENSNRPVIIRKAAIAYQWFSRLLDYYVARELLGFFDRHPLSTLNRMIARLPKAGKAFDWENIGGQLIEKTTVQNWLQAIRTGKISSWEALHNLYQQESNLYPDHKLMHALAIYKNRHGIDLSTDPHMVRQVLTDAISLRKEMTERIYESRAKDYQNEFRKMVYNSEEEMDIVVGKLNDNSFISDEQKAFRQFKKKIEGLL